MQNNKKRALLTGVTGQSGSYLSELLLSKDYEVYGLIRPRGKNLEKSNIGHLLNDITLLYGDMTDPISIQNAVIKSQAHEIYNLAAQTRVQESFDNPVYSAEVIALGYLHLLEAVRLHSPNSKVLQCGSSEMWGKNVDSDGLRREETPLDSCNPYGISKTFAHQMGINYRNSYGMFVVNIIGNNQESPRRGDDFVTSKVVREAVKISKGRSNELKLSNLSSVRDWNHSKDVVAGMYLSMQYHLSEDWVISSGREKSLSDLCEYVFSKLNLDYKNYVKIDPSLTRTQETPYLRGDSAKIRTILGWKPKYTFETLLDEMIDFERKR